MSEQKHTPEPWRAVRFEYQYGTNLVGPSNAKTGESPEIAGFVGENNWSNALRAEACVNACAGMDDPAAEIEQLRYELAEANKTCEEVDADNERLRQQLQTLASSPKPLKPLIPEYKFSDPNKPWSGETVKGTRKKKRRSSDERA